MKPLIGWKCHLACIIIGFHSLIPSAAGQGSNEPTDPVSHASRRAHTDTITFPTSINSLENNLDPSANRPDLGHLTNQDRHHSEARLHITPTTPSQQRTEDRRPKTSRWQDSSDMPDSELVNLQETSVSSHNEPARVTTDTETTTSGDPRVSNHEEPGESLSTTERESATSGESRVPRGEEQDDQPHSTSLQSHRPSERARKTTAGGTHESEHSDAGSSQPDVTKPPVNVTPIEAGALLTHLSTIDNSVEITSVSAGNEQQENQETSAALITSQSDGSHTTDVLEVPTIHPEVHRSILESQTTRLEHAGWTVPAENVVLVSDRRSNSSRPEQDPHTLTQDIVARHITDLRDEEYYNTVTISFHLTKHDNPDLLWFKREFQTFVANSLNSFAFTMQTTSDREYLRSGGIHVIAREKRNVVLPPATGVFPDDVIFIHPSPRALGSQLMVTFFAKNVTDDYTYAVVPRLMVVSALKESISQLSELISLNVTSLKEGIPRDFLVASSSSVLLVIIAISVVAVLFIILILTLIITRCGSPRRDRSRGLDYIHNKHKLKNSDMTQSSEFGHVNADKEVEGKTLTNENSADDEKNGKMFTNGNSAAHIIPSLYRDDSWVVPLDDVTLNEQRKQLDDTRF